MIYKHLWQVPVGYRSVIGPGRHPALYGLVPILMWIAFGSSLLSVIRNAVALIPAANSASQSAFVAGPHSAVRESWIWISRPANATMPALGCPGGVNTMGVPCQGWRFQPAALSEAPICSIKANGSAPGCKEKSNGTPENSITFSVMSACCVAVNERGDNFSSNDMIWPRWTDAMRSSDIKSAKLNSVSSATPMMTHLWAILANSSPLFWVSQTIPKLATMAATPAPTKSHEFSIASVSASMLAHIFAIAAVLSQCAVAVWALAKALRD